MMPLILELSTQESIIDFTEVFHGLLFNIHCDNHQNEVPEGRVMGFFFKRHKDSKSSF